MKKLIIEIEQNKLNERKKVMTQQLNVHTTATVGFVRRQKKIDDRAAMD